MIIAGTAPWVVDRRMIMEGKPLHLVRMFETTQQRDEFNALRALRLAYSRSAESDFAQVS
jgi:hypothetical protein